MKPRFLFVLSVTVALATLALPGCSLFAPQADKLAQDGGKLVKFYCDNIQSAEVRQQIRDSVNKYAAPNTVKITCAQDAPAPATEPAPTSAPSK